MAQASMARNDYEKIGSWLHGAADALDHGAEWSGYKLTADSKAIVDDAESLGAKVEGSAKWTADEVDRCVSELGSEIESLKADS
jgi:hypothetical protein